MKRTDTPTVVILPGMDGTGELLDEFVSQLSGKRPVQLIPYPENEPLDYAALVTHVRERLPSGAFVVLGESFSGPIAIEIAASEDRTVGLVLASSFARHPLPSILATPSQHVGLGMIPDRLLFLALLGSAGTPELKKQLMQILAKLPREVLALRASEVLKVDRRSQLAKVTCPILCLHGRQDRLVRTKLVEDVLQIAANARAQWFDAPHMLLETQADEAACAVAQFCDDLQ